MAPAPRGVARTCFRVCASNLAVSWGSEARRSHARTQVASAHVDARQVRGATGRGGSGRGGSAAVGSFPGDGCSPPRRPPRARAGRVAAGGPQARRGQVRGGRTRRGRPGRGERGPSACGRTESPSAALRVSLAGRRSRVRVSGGRASPAVSVALAQSCKRPRLQRARQPGAPSRGSPRVTRRSSHRLREAGSVTRPSLRGAATLSRWRPEPASSVRVLLMAGAPRRAPEKTGCPRGTPGGHRHVVGIQDTIVTTTGAEGVKARLFPRLGALALAMRGGPLRPGVFL